MTSTTTILTAEKESRTANTGFASGGVTCKLGALCFYSSSVLVDSFVLQNPPERKARNRCHATLPVKSTSFSRWSNSRPFLRQCVATAALDQILSQTPVMLHLPLGLRATCRLTKFGSEKNASDLENKFSISRIIFRNFVKRSRWQQG